MKTEHQKWFWRMDLFQRINENQRNFMADASFAEMIDRMYRENPIGFASFQFECAMMVYEIKAKREN